MPGNRLHSIARLRRCTFACLKSENPGCHISRANYEKWRWKDSSGGVFRFIKETRFQNVIGFHANATRCCKAERVARLPSSERAGEQIIRLPYVMRTPILPERDVFGRSAMFRLPLAAAAATQTCLYRLLPREALPSIHILALFLPTPLRARRWSATLDIFYESHFQLCG